jgi:hypothetical protein
MGKPLQVSVDIAKDAGPEESAQLESRMRDAMDEANGIDILDIGVRKPASVDPATLEELRVLLTNTAAVVGAGVLILDALRKFVVAAGGVIRAVRVQIAGRPIPLDKVTGEDIEKEMALRQAPLLAKRPAFSRPASETVQLPTKPISARIIYLQYCRFRRSCPGVTG